jgi:hypothetical protein
VKPRIKAATVFAASLLLTGCTRGVSAGVDPAAGPATRAERTNYLETSRYADVVSFLDSLKGRPELAFGAIGRTNEGRDIPYVVASRPRVSTPDEAKKLGRPVVYVQANIHAGEVEGKEALLAILRDLTASPRPNALDSVVLIAVPIYNADGNERFASQEQNRRSQNGPEMVGVRENAQALDLNRDYIKAEAPETRASLAMFSTWDPDVFVDLHTTDGSYHGYALTYAPPLNGAAPLAVWTRDSVMPVLRERMRSRRNFPTFDYGDFIDDDTLSKGWATFDSRPRFGTNYYGLRGKVAILSEAYSHDPFERRVKSTHAFVHEILSLAGEIAPRMRRAIAAGSASMRDIPVRSQMAAAPDSGSVVAEIVERTGDSTRTQPGLPRGRRRTGRFVTVKMPVFDRFKPVLVAPRPMRYVLAQSDTQIVRALRTHGITVTQAGRGQPNADVIGTGYVFTIDSIITSPRPFQGHREVRLTGKWRSESRTILPGSYLVDTAQPLGILAVYLLEPQSDDGLVAWNFYDAQLKPGGLYPVLKIGGVPPTP